MSRTVALQSIGCRTNHQEMTDLSFRLKQAGFTVVDGVSADIVVLNTCCVTSTAEAKTRKAIQAISRNSPQTRILVTGCGAQHNPAQFAGAQIAWVVDNSSKSDIPQILEDDKPGTFANTQAEGANTPLAIGALPDSLADARLTRLPLKIQEGCNFSCTYCIVPSVRGPSRCADEAGLCSLFERAVGL